MSALRQRACLSCAPLCRELEDRGSSPSPLRRRGGLLIICIDAALSIIVGTGYGVRVGGQRLAELLLLIYR